jgi:hypothetical protein
MNLGPLIWNTKLLASDMDGGKTIAISRENSIQLLISGTTPCNPYTKAYYW